MYQYPIAYQTLNVQTTKAEEIFCSYYLFSQTDQLSAMTDQSDKNIQALQQDMQDLRWGYKYVLSTCYPVPAQREHWARLLKQSAAK